MPQKPIVYDAPTPEPRATTVEAIQAEILERLIYSVGKDPIVARPHDWLHATILAVGAGEQRAVVKNVAVAIATIMSVTLSTDHRAVDGALGAELLAAFKRLIENPIAMLV